MSLRPLAPMSSRSKVTTTVSLLLVLVGLGTFAVAEAQRPDGESTLAAMWDALVAEPHVLAQAIYGHAEHGGERVLQPAH